MKPWYEDDDFWKKLEPVLFPQQRLKDTPEAVDRIIALLQLQSGITVLDLCCGIGRHSLEFARRGFHVTGVDRTRYYLDKASKQATTEGLKMEFVQADMGEFSRPNGFDVALNLYTSFGYFEDAEDDRRVMKNLYRSLKRGGSLIMEMMGKEIIARIFQERTWREEDGIIVLEEHRLRSGWGAIENRWIVLKDGERIEKRFTHRLYSGMELISMLTTCGFSKTEIYGDLAGNPYDQTAKRLIVVAHK